MSAPVLAFVNQKRKPQRQTRVEPPIIAVMRELLVLSPGHARVLQQLAAGIIKDVRRGVVGVVVMSGRDQAIVDKLQASIPRLQLALRAAEQLHGDVAAALSDIATATTLLRPPAPHNGERRIANLEIALVRSGKTIGELTFLTAIPEPRIKAIAAGDRATVNESKALRAALPEWQG